MTAQTNKMLTTAQLVAITMMIVLFMIGSTTGVVSLDCFVVVKGTNLDEILTMDDILTFPSWLSAMHSYLSSI